MKQQSVRLLISSNFATVATTAAVTSAATVSAVAPNGTSADVAPDAIVLSITFCAT